MKAVIRISVLLSTALPEPPPDEFTNVNFDVSESQGISNNTNMVFLPARKWIRVVLQNGGPMVHPWHLHGFKGYILAHNRLEGEGTKPPERPHTAGCTVEDPRYKPMKLKSGEGCMQAGAPWINSWGPDLIPPIRHRIQKKFTDTSELNLKNPAIRDMVIVPEHGYNVFQFNTANSGAWFFHCHLEFHVGIGMGLTWMIGATEPKDWVRSGLPPWVVVQQNEANCPDTEFEGPLQFW